MRGDLLCQCLASQHHPVIHLKGSGLSRFMPRIIDGQPTPLTFSHYHPAPGCPHLLVCQCVGPAVSRPGPAGPLHCSEAASARILLASSKQAESTLRLPSHRMPLRAASRSDSSWSVTPMSARAAQTSSKLAASSTPSISCSSSSSSVSKQGISFLGSCYIPYIGCWAAPSAAHPPLAPGRITAAPTAVPTAVPHTAAVRLRCLTTHPLLLR